MSRTIRWMAAGVGMVTGLALGLYGLEPLEVLFEVDFTAVEGIGLITLNAAIFTVIGFFLAPWVIGQAIKFTAWLENRLQKTPMADILAGAIGVIIGLIIANLLGSAFSSIPWLGVILPTLGSLLLGYLGLSVAIKKKDELFGLLNILPRRGVRERFPRVQEPSSPKILDTSVIIDGRIADICATGFLEGPLVVPGFVLEELRHIADSSDVLKRNRGRRGLDILNKMQKEPGVQVQIYERDPGGNMGVDSKLVRLARMLHGKVITNDFNLNKVAELQGVPVLNINELANAVKPIVLPGEEMVVNVIRDGKESGQGVGYLDDGTMIVVDGGKKHIGETIGVMVTSVLQTAAGRMIFAKPKVPAEKAIN